MQEACGQEHRIGTTPTDCLQLIAKPRQQLHPAIVLAYPPRRLPGNMSGNQA
jgi:hypothetical protein